MVANEMEMKLERPLGMATQVYYTIRFCMFHNTNFKNIYNINV